MHLHLLLLQQLAHRLPLPHQHQLLHQHLLPSNGPWASRRESGTQKKPREAGFFYGAMCKARNWSAQFVGNQLQNAFSVDSLFGLARGVHHLDQTLIFGL